MMAMSCWLSRAKYGSEVEDAFQMEQRSITKHLNEIKSALQKGKPVQRWGCSQQG